jgi:hypothetical protein
VFIADPTGPRPFYVIGNNLNTIGGVVDALAAGTNAIEPDLNGHMNSKDLYISHGLAGDFAPSPIGCLDQLHTIALKNPQLALVVFECIPRVCSPGNGLILITAVRERLTFDIPVNITLSVASLDDSKMVDSIHPRLRSREGL